MTSSYDIAAMIITPLISYIGGSRKKPLFCAWGLFTMGVGFFIFMLPHFVSPPYQATGRWIRLTFTQFTTKNWTLLRSCLPSFSIPCCFFALFLLYKTSLDMLPAFSAASSSPFLSEALCRTCAPHPCRQTITQLWDPFVSTTSDKTRPDCIFLLNLTWIFLLFLYQPLLQILTRVLLT